jgi:hypothetical protein
MHAQNFVVNKGSNREAVKHVLELFPNSDAEFALHFVIETIDSVDLRTLVVSS